jgi:hypothetical protein
VLSRRRKMLLDMAAGIELEMRDSLGEELFKLGIRLLTKALQYGPLARDPEWFNDDENFGKRRTHTNPLRPCVVNPRWAACFALPLGCLHCAPSLGSPLHAADALPAAWHRDRDQSLQRRHGEPQLPRVEGASKRLKPTSAVATSLRFHSCDA